jgi:hypothetical protein
MYNSELLSHMFERWQRLANDIYKDPKEKKDKKDKDKKKDKKDKDKKDKKDKKKDEDVGGFDLSKLPDVYDAIKYDMLHNQQLVCGDDGQGGHGPGRELYLLARDLSCVVVPQEVSRFPSCLLRTLRFCMLPFARTRLLTSFLLYCPLHLLYTAHCICSILPTAFALYTAHCICSTAHRNQYGITPAEKLVIGTKVCRKLLHKIVEDIQIATDMNKDPHVGGAVHASPGAGVGADGAAGSGGSGGSGEGGIHSTLDTSHAEFGDLDIRSLKRAVRTRLYFTSESHIISMINVLRHSKLAMTAAEDAAASAAPGGGGDYKDNGKGGGGVSLEALPPKAPVTADTPSSISSADGSTGSIGSADAPSRAYTSVHGRQPQCSVDLTAADVREESHHIEPADVISSKKAKEYIASTPELNYMAHLVFRVFERFGQEATDKGRFRVELAVSHGGSVPRNCGLLDSDDDEEEEEKEDGGKEKCEEVEQKGMPAEAKEGAKEKVEEEQQQEQVNRRRNSKTVSATETTQMLKELQTQLRRDEREKELKGKLHLEQLQKKEEQEKKEREAKQGRTQKMSKQKAGQMKQFELEKAVMLEDSLTPEELVSHLLSCLENIRSV